MNKSEVKPRYSEEKVLPKDIVDKIMLRNRLRKEFQRPPMKTKYNRLRREIDQNIDTFRFRRWRVFIEGSQTADSHRAPRILKRSPPPMLEIKHG